RARVRSHAGRRGPGKCAAAPLAAAVDLTSPMNAPQRPIDFYLDFSSPSSSVASEWIEALAARHGRTVNWKAILLGVTFQAAELKSPVAYPLKREYTLLDFERSARFAGVPLKIPAKFPIPTQNAARLFWWLQQRGDL